MPAIEFYSITIGALPFSAKIFFHFGTYSAFYKDSEIPRCPRCSS